MDTRKIIALLQGKINKDYTYNFFFFLIFSFFVFAAIRPNLITAFSLQRELQELRLKNRQAEEKILKLVAYQSTIQLYRDALSNLDSAIPSSPRVAEVVKNIRDTSLETGIQLDDLNVQSVEFIDKEGGGELLTIEANIETEGSRENLDILISSLFQQLRLKTLDKITITTSDNNTYNFNILIKSYFL